MSCCVFACTKLVSLLEADSWLAVSIGIDVSLLLLGCYFRVYCLFHSKKKVILFELLLVIGCNNYSLNTHCTHTATCPEAPPKKKITQNTTMIPMEEFMIRQPSHPSKSSSPKVEKMSPSK